MVGYFSRNGWGYSVPQDWILGVNNPDSVLILWEEVESNGIQHRGLCRIERLFSFQAE